jgi:multidrug efflux system membrane fusion protein
MAPVDTARRPRRGRWIALLVVVVIVGGGYAVWRRQQAQTVAAQAAMRSPPPIVVTVATAQTGSFDVKLDGIGIVQPINTVVVRSRVDGQIEEVFFKEGQTVKAGDLLLRIDQRPFKAALEQAQAKLAQDQATLANARLDLQRYSTLAKQQFASRQQLDTQQTAVHTGTALNQADQAAIDNAQVQLGYTEIRAPLTGRVGFRLVDPGNIVHATDVQGLLSIVQVDPINVLYTLAEADLAAVQQAFSKGKVPVTATVAGRRVAPSVDGAISVVNNQVDQTSGTVQIKAVFANADLRLWPGQSVTTKTMVQRLDNVLLVPPEAIQHGPDGLFVWRIDEQNIASPDRISIGDQDTNAVVVEKGLSAGDTVVTVGALRLRNGTKVQPQPARQASLTTGGAQ